MYHHKSGAQKRKQRVERDQKRINSQKGQGKLSNFNFVPKIISVPNNKTDPEQPSTSYASPTNTPLCKQSEEPPESAEKTEELFNDSVNALLTPPKPVLNEQSKSQNNKKLNNYDIGTATTKFISSQY
uniref:Uncharacterized protein LOC114328057 n=1 Tax=Diabrotica virgifera virgifera TaxID=50390 RepID=A0A6P7FHM8_DIAVI